MGCRNLSAVGSPAALLLLAAVGCLPDPRPYDACTDDESYYSVAPVGCAGHELAVLGSRTFDMSQTFSPPFVDGSASFVVDETFVYWPDMAGNVLRTPKKGGRTEVLLEAAGGASYIALASSESSLYVLRKSQSGVEQSDAASLFSVDKSTKRVLQIASLPYIDAFQLQILGNKFYARDPSRACIVEGSLDGGNNAASSYPCVMNELPLQFQVTERGVVYIIASTAVPAIVLQPLDGSTRTVLMTLQNYPSSLRADSEHLYFAECSDVCRRYRADYSGARQLLVENLGMASYVIGDAETTYAVTQLAGEYGESRLYAWSHPSPSPSVMAASLGGAYALTLDDDYLFAIVPEFSGGPDPGTLQLLRISR